MLTTRKMYFAHPSAWGDPYERVLKHERASAIFAQCWCRKALSDAMWRIYSPHGLGVRIGTTRQRLQAALAAEKQRRKITFKIQNVEYLYQEALDAELQKAKANLTANYTFANAVEPLFFKRKAFDHERETRAVVFDSSCLTSEACKGITIDIEPFNVITSIWIDPRAPQAYVDAYKYYLKKKLKFPGTVEKSKLYLVPNVLSVARSEG
jgi:Protein of unknown function (DUF2971)